MVEVRILELIKDFILPLLFIYFSLLVIFLTVLHFFEKRAIRKEEKERKREENKEI